MGVVVRRYIDTIVWEIFDLQIFSYNNCSKFKRVKFSHGE